MPISDIAKATHWDQNQRETRRAYVDRFDASDLFSIAEKIFSCLRTHTPMSISRPHNTSTGALIEPGTEDTGLDVPDILTQGHSLKIKWDQDHIPISENDSTTGTCLIRGGYV